MNVGSDCGYFKPNLDNLGLEGNPDAQYIVTQECMNSLKSEPGDINTTYSQLRLCSRDITCGEKFRGAANISHENDTITISGCDALPCECPLGEPEGSGNECINGYKCKEDSCNDNHHFDPLTKRCITSQCDVLTQSYLNNHNDKYRIDVNTCDTSNLYYDNITPPTISTCGLTCKDDGDTNGTPLATCTAGGSWEFTGCSETLCECENGTSSGSIESGECSEEILNNCSECNPGYMLNEGSCTRHCPEINATMLPELYKFNNDVLLPSSQCITDSSSIIFSEGNFQNNQLPDSCNISCKDSNNSQGEVSAQCESGPNDTLIWSQFQGCENICAGGMQRCLENYPDEYYDECSEIGQCPDPVIPPGDRECYIKLTSGEYLQLGAVPDTDLAWCSINIDVDNFDDLITQNSTCIKTIGPVESTNPITSAMEITSTNLPPEVDLNSSPLILIDGNTIYSYNSSECINTFKELLSDRSINKSDENTKTVYYRFSDQSNLFNN